MELIGLGFGAAALTLPIIIMLLSMCCLCSSSLSCLLSVFFGSDIPIIGDQLGFIQGNINQVYGSVTSSSCISCILLILVIGSLVYRSRRY